MIEQIKKLIVGGENQKVEFKEAGVEFPKSAYESVCAFLNTDGGIILLGVKDNGEVTGINASKIQKMKSDFINVMNSGSKINPAIHLDINDIVINDKTILYIKVFQSSQVHRCNGKTYIRISDKDKDISTDNRAISQLFLTKDSSYSENKIFPAVRYEQLREDLINRGRNLALIQNPNHPWKEMDNMTILKRSSLYIENPTTGEKGFTLAAILLFGTDELIAAAVPAFRIDIIKRVEDVKRFDDRLDLRTNLIESYDKILEFISKHLPDPFYLEGVQRISLRENIFRELVANFIVHKEYANAEPTRLVIERERIYTENSNKPYINGIINLDNLVTHPKNPNITRFFKEIGRVEELGSGIEKIINYCRAYTGNIPVFKDENIFTFTLKHDLFPVKITSKEQQQCIFTFIDQVDSKSEQVTGQVNQKSEQVTDQVHFEKTILEFCVEPKSLKEILIRTGYVSRNHFKNAILNPLIEKGMIQLTQPNSLNSPTQKYVTVIKNEDDNVKH